MTPTYLTHETLIPLLLEDSHLPYIEDLVKVSEVVIIPPQFFIKAGMHLEEFYDFSKEDLIRDFRDILEIDGVLTKRPQLTTLLDYWEKHPGLTLAQSDLKVILESPTSNIFEKALYYFGYGLWRVELPLRKFFRNLKN